MDDLSLPALFEQAKNIYHSSLDGGIDLQVARKGCEILRTCEDMIRIFGIFSANETKEDISTTDLKYILEGGGSGAGGGATKEVVKKSKNVLRKLEKRQKDQKLDAHIEDQFGGGRLLACIASRHGQCGRADGYILEGKELEFYSKKIQKKKGKSGGGGSAA